MKAGAGEGRASGALSVGVLQYYSGSGLGWRVCWKRRMGRSLAVGSGGEGEGGMRRGGIMRGEGPLGRGEDERIRCAGSG